MKKLTLSILSVTAIALSVSSCYNDNFKELNPSTSACDTSNTVTYQTDVKAIIDANCVSCHSTGGTQPYLDSYQKLTGLNPDGLLGVLASNAAKPMPPSNPMAQTNIDKITQWVKGCRPYGVGTTVTTCDTSAAMSFSLNIKPILAANCTNGCHDNNGYGHSMLTAQDIYLNNDTALITTGSGPSFLEHSLTTSNLSKLMPLGRPKLSACQIAKIRRWVTEGSLDN